MFSIIILWLTFFTPEHKMHTILRSTEENENENENKQQEQQMPKEEEEHKDKENITIAQAHGLDGVHPF